MTYRYPVLAFASFVAVSAGCGTAVIGGNSGGAGGAPETTTGSTSTGSTSTSTSTSSTSTSSSTSSTSSSTSTSSSGGGAQPPPPGAMHLPDGSGPAVFAVSKLYLGTTNRDGTPDFQNAWKQYGYDLDGDVSTAASTNLCKPQQNAAVKNIYPDGNDGIDNSFGKNILPIFLGISPDVEQKANASIASGKGTILLDLENLGAGAEYDPMVGRAYRGGDLGQPPSWNGADAWPVNADSLSAPPTLASAKAQSAQTYVVGNVWVARIAGDLSVMLDAGGFPLPLQIHNPIITMQLDASHQHATFGTIAGVIPAASLVGTIKQVAGAFDPSLCSGPTIDSITSQITQASDILVDGTQDPTQACDGISIGLGFDAQRVTFGGVQTPVPPPNPCP